MRIGPASRCQRTHRSARPRFGEIVPMRTIVLAVLLASSAGCSWMMVAGPQPASTGVVISGPPGSAEASIAASSSPGDCTREKFAPIVDTVFASQFAAGAAVTAPLGTALAFSKDDWNQMFGVMLIGASVTYALMAWPFIVSARTGYRKVAACRRAYERAYGSVYPRGTLGGASL